jgi:hypothetical protein
MYKIDCHDSGQTKLWAIRHKFRNTLKQRTKDDYKIRFHNVFNEEQKALINRYHNNPYLLDQIVFELEDFNLFLSPTTLLGSYFYFSQVCCIKK